MLNKKLTVSMLAALVATSSIAFADDDDQSASESESAESSEFHQVLESAGEKAAEMTATLAMDDEAAGAAMKYGLTAVKIFAENDPNKNVDTLLSSGVEYVSKSFVSNATSAYIAEGSAAFAGDVIGGAAGLFLAPQYTGPASFDDDGNHSQYQGTALGDSKMIAEPADDQSDPDALQIEPISDDEMLSAALGASSQTSTPAPQTSYTPDPPATPAPSDAPSPSPSYSSGRGYVRAE